MTLAGASSGAGRSPRLTIGVIGYGYWGPNLVRNFFEIPDAFVASVADTRQDRLDVVRARYPTIQTMTSAEDLIGNPGIDAVVIATPVGTHFELAMKALQAGKHVLVEKPIATTSAEVERLIETAKVAGLVLMVDHIFVYTGAVRKIKELISAGQLGEVYYYDSVRVNLGLFQSDVNVLWDLAVHDLSIIDFVLPERPVAVSAHAAAHVAGQPENIAYLTLKFPGKKIAHLHVNWLAPVKVRRTLIGGRDRMIVYDSLDPSEKIKVYDEGTVLDADPESKYKMLVTYRYGDMWAPRLDDTEALLTEGQHFIDCIRKGDQPLTGGDAGLRVVRTLEAAERSMRDEGRLTPIDPG